MLLFAIIFFCGQNNFANAEEKFIYKDSDGYKYYIVTEKIHYVNYEKRKGVYVPLIEDRNGKKYTKSYMYCKNRKGIWKCFFGFIAPVTVEEENSSIYLAFVNAQKYIDFDKVPNSDF